MERNNLALLSLVGAGLLAAVALGIVLRGSTDPQTTEPIEAADAKGTDVAAANAAGAKAPQLPPGARTIPDRTPVPADGYITTESGLQYFDIAEGSGDQPVDGSQVTVEYSGWLEDGTLFDSSFKRPSPFAFPLGKGSVIAGWDEGVATMKPGGKRQLRIPADLAYGDQRKGPIPGGSTLIFDVELIKIGAPRVPPTAPRVVADADYTVTETGLKYHDQIEGEGRVAVSGDRVSVDYTGWLQDGTMFDSSLKRASPISFAVGTGKVIPGWDEGIQGMKVGTKRQLLIPSELAYGERGRPGIPPNSTLTFDVELVDLK